MEKATTSIIAPKYLSLDSSSLRELTRNALSRETQSCTRASRFLEHLNETGQYLVVSLSHFLELIQHGNDEVAFEFPRFLATLPNVAWVRTPDSNALGTIVDILAFEVEAIALGGFSTPKDVAHEVRRRLLRFGSGAELMEPLWPSLDEMRNQFRRRASARESQAALERLQMPSVMATAFARIRSTPGKAPAHLIKAMAEMQRQLMLEQVKQKSKVHDPEAVVEAFLTFCAREISAMGAGPIDPNAMLRHFGIDPEDVDDGTSVEDLAKVAEFNAKVKLAVTRLDFDDNDSRIRRIKMGLCPSWIVGEAIRVQRSADSGARGSDVHDSYLATLSCYADRTEVDRRTFNYLGQACRTDVTLRVLLKDVVRTPYYKRITEGLVSVTDTDPRYCSNSDEPAVSEDSAERDARDDGVSEQ